MQRCLRILYESINVRPKFFPVPISTALRCKMSLTNNLFSSFLYNPIMFGTISLKENVQDYGIVFKILSPALPITQYLFNFSINI